MNNLNHTNNKTIILKTIEDKLWDIFWKTKESSTCKGIVSIIETIDEYTPKEKQQSQLGEHLFELSKSL